MAAKKKKTAAQRVKAAKRGSSSKKSSKGKKSSKAKSKTPVKTPAKSPVKGRKSKSVGTKRSSTHARGLKRSKTKKPEPKAKKTKRPEPKTKKPEPKTKKPEPKTKPKKRKTAAKVSKAKKAQRQVAKTGKALKAAQREAAKTRKALAAKVKKPATKAPRKPAAKVRKPPPKPKPKIVPPRTVYAIRAADPSGFGEDGSRWEGKSRRLSHFNSSHNVNFYEAFEGYFNALAARSNAADPDLIPIYRFGFSFRSEDMLNRSQLQAAYSMVSKELARPGAMPRGWIAHVVDEGTNISVHVGLGHAEKHRTITQVMSAIERASIDLEMVKRLIDDTMGDSDWMSFVDIPDEWDVGS